jgi:uncharacterized protein with FMN-binding domain
LKRAAAALAATVAGLIAILGYKSGPARRTTLGTLAPSTTTPPSPPTTGTPAAGPTTNAPAGTAAKQTITGPDEPNQYGDVQVQVTIQGGRITDVEPLQLPQDRQRSAEISREAAPLLRSEALQAQSGNIDGVSGATYTSEGYAQSLQAALDQARS